MFLGTFTPKLDDKGRFFLPAKFREQLNEGLVITRAQDRCLAIWEPERFAEEVQKAATGPSTVQRVRAYQRMVSSGASDDTPDGQGRVTIPQSLREYAGLTKEIVVIGAYNRLEVWDAATWAEYSAAAEEEFASLDEELFPAG
ncbi:MAG: division/cell wall cluster transcriptional repressor MraZ [Propionicimonas sp.]|uniref:division/cell wall cluster transcriptional repressor MraZ n=1 Tax=Propionicimonas sp. TaxID=1955623 RepID=UPI002B217FC2|nr:division/cell wall cluster transcriptional repressor MraZ [Propionicimonas sp.]MEA4943016.1 division/cell wall cluster transcriptional repressor MraZ [Propionicimonas sp.]